MTTSAAVSYTPLWSIGEINAEKLRTAPPPAKGEVGRGWLLMFHKLKSKPHPNPPLEKRGGSLSFPRYLIKGMGVVYKS